MRLKNGLMNFSLLLAGIMVALLLLEIILRVTYLLQPSELVPTQISGLPYENRPSSAFWRYDYGLSWIKYTKNSYGFRSPEISVEKPKSTRRILVLGDSVAFGGNVRNQETFSAQLEAFLNPMSAFGSWQVINTGTSSYNFHNYWSMLMGKGAQFNPDAVIICITANDFEIDRGNDITRPPSASATALPRTVSLLLKKTKTFLGKSYLLDHVKKKFNYGQEEAKLSPEEKQVVQLEVESVFKNDPSTRQAFTWLAKNEGRNIFALYKNLLYSRNMKWDVVQPIMANFGTWSKQHQVPIYLFFCPTRVHCVPGNNSTVPEPLLLSMAFQNGLHPVPMIDAFQEHYRQGDQALFARSDYLHPLAPGHTVIAQRLCKRLIDDGLIK